MENTRNTQHGERAECWPALPYEAWRDSCQTLHLWTQIVGKVRMALSPFLNHWWHVTLYITSLGLTTSAIPYHGGTFEITFDFIDHNLCICMSDGTTKALPLLPRSVAAFYREFMACLHALGIEVTINPLYMLTIMPRTSLSFRLSGARLPRLVLWWTGWWPIIARYHTDLRSET